MDYMIFQTDIRTSFFSKGKRYHIPLLLSLLTK